MGTKRLIDANHYDQILDKREMQLMEYSGSISGAIKGCRAILAQEPTVDAVEVVRCKDCKHYDNSEGIQWCHLNSKFYPGGMDWLSYPEDGFCCYGERKDNGL